MSSDKGTWLPHNLHLNMLSEKCSLSDVYLVSLVYSFDKGNKVFYASNKYISKLLGVTERRVRQIVTNLVESGWLQRSMKTCNRGSERHLTITNKTREAIFNPPREEDYCPLEGVVFSSNNKNNNKENNIEILQHRNKVLFQMNQLERLFVMILKLAILLQMK